jgi:glutathione peroxidase
VTDARAERARERASELYEIGVTTISGERATLDAYRGRVLLIVNVASKCGFTPQYAGLEMLHRKYRDRGLSVLGFPCDQFGHQEPGDEAEIASFCALTYDVSFPMFAKIDVNGTHTHPLYRLLKRERPGALGSTAIKWNFTKFLVDRSGVTRERFAPRVEPAELEGRIAEML